MVFCGHLPKTLSIMPIRITEKVLYSMEKIVINGGTPLNGCIEVSGMKNAALPILMGCLLTEDRCIIENLPEIDDVTLSLKILQTMGLTVRMLNRNTVEIDATHAVGGTAPIDLVRRMRASARIV